MAIAEAEMIEVIAEIGVNHNGDFKTAVRLLDEAKFAGCDTAKFQLFHGDRYPELQLAPVELKDLKDCCANRGLKFLCTPDDIEDAHVLRDYVGVDRIKIGSSNVTNIVLIEEIARWNIPIILSTGACTRTELLRAIQAASLANPKRLPDVMHCVSAYPASDTDLNLAVFRDPSIRYTGFSDHTLGDTAAMMALALGARVFEKHLTLHVGQDGPDHAASLAPMEMRNYVQHLKQAERIMGSGFKEIMPSEVANRVDYERFVEAQYCAGGTC